MSTDTTNAIPANPPVRRRRLFSRLLYGTAGLLVVSVIAFAAIQPIKVLPRIGLSPGFALTNQEGVLRNSEDYRGRATLFSFACSRSDPATLRTMATLSALRANLRESTPAGIELAIVTIGVDPEHDTPPIWNEFASKYAPDGAKDPVRWDFARGDTETTRLVVGGGFGVFYSNSKQTNGGANQPAVALDGRIVIVDGWGIIRAVYRQEDFDANRAMRDLQSIAAEARSSKGLSHLAYETAHLFRCYA